MARGAFRGRGRVIVMTRGIGLPTRPGMLRWRRMAVRVRARLNVLAALGVTVEQTPIERTREHDDGRHEDDELPAREIRQPDHDNG